MGQDCRQTLIPKWLRVALGWMLIGIGLPLFLTPIPGGFLLIAAGGMLLFNAAPTLRRLLWKGVSRFPKLSRRVARLFNTSDLCPNTCQTDRPPNLISPCPTSDQGITPQTDKTR